eukprot:SAG22_NODE_171_length_16646_cov_6.580528_10_plen_347_part_00
MGRPPVFSAVHCFEVLIAAGCTLIVALVIVTFDTETTKACLMSTAMSVLMTWLTQPIKSIAVVILVSLVEMRRERHNLRIARTMTVAIDGMIEGIAQRTDSDDEDGVRSAALVAPTTGSDAETIPFADVQERVRNMGYRFRAADGDLLTAVCEAFGDSDGSIRKAEFARLMAILHRQVGPLDEESAFDLLKNKMGFDDIDRTTFTGVFACFDADHSGALDMEEVQQLVGSMISAQQTAAGDDDQRQHQGAPKDQLLPGSVPADTTTNMTTAPAEPQPLAGRGSGRGGGGQPFGAQTVASDLMSVRGRGRGSTVAARDVPTASRTSVPAGANRGRGRGGRGGRVVGP